MNDGLTPDPSRREAFALAAPPLSLADPASLEFLRAWVSGEQVAVKLREDLWLDPAAWGVALVDVAVAAARTYGGKGLPMDVALDRIREGLDAEWALAASGPDTRPAPLAPEVSVRTVRAARARRKSQRRRAPTPRGGR